METKTYSAALKFKGDEQPGEFEAVFATLNVIDHHKDVTLPGAFGEQRVLVEPWNHNFEAPPVGKGVIAERGNEAVVNGRFFLGTAAGREHYEVAKELQEDQEFSYSFDILESEMGTFGGEPVRFLKKLAVIGVGQVTMGAGIDTRLLTIKGQKKAIGPHSTATTGAAWDGPGNVARLSNEAGAATYRRMFAWVDPDGDPDAKGSYKFPHHLVGEDGAVGAASVRACSAGIAALNGGRGGAAIPDGDRQGVWNHLAKHLRDADMEPPELKAAGAAAGLEAEDGDDDQAASQAMPANGTSSGVSPEVMTVLINILELED
jgi:hypothetical protein